MACILYLPIRLPHDPPIDCEWKWQRSRMCELVLRHLHLFTGRPNSPLRSRLFSTVRWLCCGVTFRNRLFSTVLLAAGVIRSCAVHGCFGFRSNRNDCTQLRLFELRRLYGSSMFACQGFYLYRVHEQLSHGERKVKQRAKLSKARLNKATQGKARHNKVWFPEFGARLGFLSLVSCCLLYTSPSPRD